MLTNKQLNKHCGSFEFKLVLLRVACRYGVTHLFIKFSKNQHEKFSNSKDERKLRLKNTVYLCKSCDGELQTWSATIVAIIVNQNHTSLAHQHWIFMIKSNAMIKMCRKCCFHFLFNGGVIFVYFLIDVWNCEFFRTYSYSRSVWMWLLSYFAKYKLPLLQQNTTRD